ncbi:ferredoxin-type protein NapG [Sulfurospirillum sp. 1612]|uniref:ferredoxin-type protein NapG n=1 Tax=Sulfurospirillum sp. 1612 TaxID=3094835 RepID=UPI002F925CE4
MKSPKSKKIKISERRRFISLVTQSIGITALGGFIWSGYLQEAKATPLILRPPGALKEDDFLKTCIKCGLCAEACKNRSSNPDQTHQTSTLIMAKPGDGMPMGTPYFIPRSIPCTMCEDIPCVEACPSGSLDKNLLIDMAKNRTKMDINKAKMGVAMIDPHACIAYWGIQCDACFRACPLLNTAITLELKKNDRTGKHAMLLPFVHADACTGCGLCEHACVTEKAAIRVLPVEVALGKAGDRYIKGWDKADENRLEGVSTKTTTQTKRSAKNPTDYLNEGVSYE